MTEKDFHLNTKCDRIENINLSYLSVRDFIQIKNTHYSFEYVRKECAVV